MNENFFGQFSIDRSIHNKTDFPNFPFHEQKPFPIGNIVIYTVCLSCPLVIFQNFYITTKPCYIKQSTINIIFFSTNVEHNYQPIITYYLLINLKK